MEWLKLNILGIWWKENGDFVSNDHWIIYSEEEKNERGVNRQKQKDVHFMLVITIRHAETKE